MIEIIWLIIVRTSIFHRAEINFWLSEICYGCGSEKEFKCKINEREKFVSEYLEIWLN